MLEDILCCGTYRKELGGPMVTYLGHQTLKEAGEALILGHVGQDPKAALRVLEIPILDTRLDDV